MARRRALVCIALATTLAAVAVTAGRLYVTKTVDSIEGPLDGVLVAGCDEVDRGGQCQVRPSTTLNLFVPGPSTIVRTISADGELAPEMAEVDGGHRVTVRLGSKPPRDLEIVVDAPVRRRARVRLVTLGPPPSWLAAAQDEKSRGNLAGARAKLEEAPRSLGERDEADLSSLRARLTLAAGDSDTAQRALAASAEAHRRLGRASRAADDETARAFVLLEMRALDEARATLDRAEQDASVYPAGQANVAYHRGELARARGELRRASEALAGATVIAERIGYGRLLSMSGQLRALVLVDTGRPQDALALLEQLERRTGESVVGCDRADLANNKGWAALVAKSGGAAIDPIPALLEAERGYEACNNPRGLANVRVNLAWGWLLARDASGARRALEAARAGLDHLDAFVDVFARDLDGRIALAENAPEHAIVAFAEVAGRARALALPLEEARAEEGRARALLARKDLRGAEQAAARADALVDAGAALVAIGEGRGTFRATRDGAARIRFEAALERGDTQLALDIARASRTRTAVDLERLAGSASLPEALRDARAAALAEFRTAREDLLAEAAHDWELPAGAIERVVEARRERAARLITTLETRLRTFAPARSSSKTGLVAAGEVAMVVHPTLDGWAAIVVTHEQTRSVRLALPARLESETSDAVARALFEPFAAELAGANRLRFFASGAMRAIDVHALEPAARLVVVYPMDIEPDAAPRPTLAPGAALVVADPRLDLRGAAREGHLVKEALARDGRSVRLLSGPAATRAAVLEGLASADVFHYAGHGTHAGLDGWESELLLAAGTRVGVADIATLGQVPRIVVLSACDAAREVGEIGEEHVGIAQAFLAARAEVVIAATRLVADETTQALMERLYAGLARKLHPAAALAQARAELREAQPAADVAAFRAFVQ